MKVYAGIDPLTGREIRLRRTCKTERAAQIELGKLLEQAVAGRQPDSAVTVAQLLDQYVLTAGWDVSTRESNLGYIRRTIKPAIGSTQVRKVRGPLLDTLYARLMRCGNLTCAGRPFTEHRNVPDLRPDPADPRPEWQQAADKLQAAIETEELAPGDALPSVPDLAQLQGLKPGTVRHMFIALAEAGLVHIRHGRTTTVTGEPGGDTRASGRVRATRPQYGHDCELSGCKPHVCKPMAKSTIHIIHSILSGAFEAAERWEWVDRNPADSARPPTVTQKKRPATPPADVVNVIDQARAAGQQTSRCTCGSSRSPAYEGASCAPSRSPTSTSATAWYISRSTTSSKPARSSGKTPRRTRSGNIAIDPVTCALIQETLDETTTALAAVGVTLAPSAFLFSNDPAHSRPWNPDWVTHRVCDLAKAAEADLDIKGIRHYTASQLLAAGFDLGNTAARLGHSGGGATTLKHYADPISEVDRRAAAYLAQLTTSSAARSG